MTILIGSWRAPLKEVEFDVTAHMIEALDHWEPGRKSKNIQWCNIHHTLAWAELSGGLAGAGRVGWSLSGVWSQQRGVTQINDGLLGEASSANWYLSEGLDNEFRNQIQCACVMWVYQDVTCDVSWHVTMSWQWEGGATAQSITGIDAANVEKSFSLFSTMSWYLHWSQGVQVTCQLSLVHSSQIHTCHVYSNCLSVCRWL